LIHKKGGQYFIKEVGEEAIKKVCNEVGERAVKEVTRKSVGAAEKVSRFLELLRRPPRFGYRRIDRMIPAAGWKRNNTDYPKHS
tara:strand:+ start:1780 stop:2031 length:252 start_codon:yes stop_codon:yes gene_type:complete